MIVVDLDGALFCTDPTFERIAMLLRRPWLLLAALFRLPRGRAQFDAELEKHVDLEVSRLPADMKLVGWLETQHQLGRKLALVSASGEAFVRQAAERFGFFDDVESVREPNGTRASCYDRLANRYGQHFTYAGHRQSDLPLWTRCGHAVMVRCSPRLRGRLPSTVQIEREFPRVGATARTWMQALRLHQWVKNALLFVPLLLSGSLQQEAVLATFIGFVVFGLIASAAYLLNDLMDLPADRAHPVKSARPFAAGTLSIGAGLAAIPVLAAAAIALLTLLPERFALISGAYVVLTVMYSARFKREPVLDLFVLALLYTIRIIAGMVAIGAPLSPWLLAFSMFFFCSVAAIKRFAEVWLLSAEGRTHIDGRGYHAGDGTFLLALGLASGFCSMLVFFIYLVDPNSPAHQFRRPELMSFICVILGYWLARAWLIASRGMMDDDPVLFALRDRMSLALGVLLVLLVCAARWW